jgi:hypothetical protein
MASSFEKSVKGATKIKVGTHEVDIRAPTDHVTGSATEDEVH